MLETTNWSKNDISVNCHRKKKIVAHCINYPCEPSKCNVKTEKLVKILRGNLVDTVTSVTAYSLLNVLHILIG